MIEVRIPKEINEYKEKVIFGLSIRQLIFFTITILISIGTYFVLTTKLGMTMDGASYIIILISIPLMAIGFIKVNGFPFEKYFLLVIRHKLGKQKREYGTNLLIDEIKEKKIETSENVKGGNKYAWIFEKEPKTGKKEVISRKERKQDRKISEAEETNFFKTTKKERKRKRKASLKQIKRARQEYR